MGISRRSFLAGAAALAGLSGCRTSAACDRRRIALNASTVRNCGLSLEEQVEAVAKAGFAGFEPWTRDVREVRSKGRLGAVVERAREFGLTFVNGLSRAPWSHDDPGIRAIGLEELKLDMAVLSEMGCPSVSATVFGMHRPGAKYLTLLEIAERYAAVCELGERMGVRPLLEYWGDSVNMNRLDDALGVLGLVGRDDTAVLADVFQTQLGGGNFAAFSWLRPGMLPVLHVSDWPDRTDEPLTDADRTWPGDGDAPWSEIVERLRTAGLAPWLSLELPASRLGSGGGVLVALREAKARMDWLAEKLA